jgi:hypothetical protein
MSEYLTGIDYDKLVEKSLKHVVIDALKIVEKQGLPGDNHFYISFRTNHSKAKIDDLVKSQYPKEMTIVLQHQFSNLKVDRDSFSVTLSFNHIPCQMTIPFDAITYFGDPSVHFGISFGSEIDTNIPEEEDKTQPKNADVISIDAFRKKGNA